MASESQPKLDLKFKEGETIKVNLNIAVCTLSSRLSLSWTDARFYRRKVLVVPKRREAQLGSCFLLRQLPLPCLPEAVIRRPKNLQKPVTPFRGVRREQVLQKL